jgi:2-oxoacid:acceptor oxidoreductase gamma subunit (pyruvate/2-ketoisovalerate family)
MLMKMIYAGFGGQGVLTAGKIVMYAAHKQNKQVTWFPSYGSEMRGGSANCNVIISDRKIASPYADHPDIVVALNENAINEFESSMKSDSIMFVNSSIVDEARSFRDDINVIKVPVTELAQKVGNERAANICMLGALVKNTNMFDKQSFSDSMCEYFDNQGKGKFNASNIEAFTTGYDY